MTRGIAVGAAFGAVLVLLLGAVTIPLWAHPMNEAEARALAVQQQGLSGYQVLDTSFAVSVDGRVINRKGVVVYTRSDWKLNAAGLVLTAPAAYWVVELQPPARRMCSSARVIIDAGSGKVVAVTRQALACRMM